MNNTATRVISQHSIPQLGALRIRRNLVFGIIMLVALLAFELFNYSTTDYALSDFLGKLTFAGVRWSTILALAFCAIDFAGIARLFTTDPESSPTRQAWYLFGAWMLAATMNALLTWWGVSMALLNHSIQSTAVLDPGLLIKIVPVFVAIMVWVIRILLIGSLTYSGEKILSAPAQAYPTVSVSRPHKMAVRPGTARPEPRQAPAAAPAARVNPPSMARPMAASAAHAAPRPEPTYHSLSAAESPRPVVNAQNPTRK